MLRVFKNGQTSVILRVKLLDSSSTTGAGLTGLTSASTGLIISTIADVEASATAYTVAGSTIETITTLGTYAAPTATKCRFKEVDATNHPGVYEVQLADARFAVSNAKAMILSLSGATNLQQADYAIQLQSDDPYVAKPANYASLSIDSNGRVDVIKLNGTSQTARDIGASVLLSAGTGTGQLDFTSGVVKSNLSQILGTALTETAGQIAAAFKKLFDVASPVFTATSVNQTGDNYARLGAPAGASVSADVAAVKTDTAAIKAKTDSLTFTVATMVDANVVDWKGATAPAMTGDAYARLGAPAGASVSADIAALPTAAANADKLLGRNLNGGADGTRTVQDALRLLRNKTSVAAGTLTVTKEDDTTAAWTATIATTAGDPISSVDPA